MPELIPQTAKFPGPRCVCVVVSQDEQAWYYGIIQILVVETFICCEIYVP